MAAKAPLAPQTARRILSRSWRAAQRIAERDELRAIALMDALSRIQTRLKRKGAK